MLRGGPEPLFANQAELKYRAERVKLCGQLSTFYLRYSHGAEPSQGSCPEA